VIVLAIEIAFLLLWLLGGVAVVKGAER